MENMKLTPHMELTVSVYDRSFVSTLLLVSREVYVIRPELCCVESRKSIVYYVYFWGVGFFGISSYGILLWLLTYYGPEGFFSVFNCMLNNVLDMGRNVLSVRNELIDNIIKD
jgi:hypothetical protein